MKVYNALKPINLATLERYCKLEYDGATFEDLKGKKGKIMMRQGKENGPKRFVDYYGNIYVSTWKDDQFHGLSFSVYKDSISVSIKRERKELLLLNFKASGEVLHRDNYDGEFTDVVPREFLKEWKIGDGVKNKKKREFKSSLRKLINLN